MCKIYQLKDHPKFIKLEQQEVEGCTLCGLKTPYDLCESCVEDMIADEEAEEFI